MSFVRIGDGSGSVDVQNRVQDHTILFAGNQLFLFGLKYVAQKTHNWGHRIAHQGGYVLVFNLDSKQWAKHQFDAVSTDENTDELLFSAGGAVYLLLSTNFNQLDTRQLFRWTGSQFDELSLEAPSPRSFDERRLGFIIADGRTSNGKLVLVSSNMNVFTLELDGKNAKIEFVYEVTENVNRMRGTALSAAVVKDKVAISFGIHGCGFSWENGLLIVVDMHNKDAKEVQIELDDESPRFCAIGAKAHALVSDDEWIHAVGRIRHGMTDDLFDGKVFALKNALGGPSWQKLAVEVPKDLSGDFVIDAETRTLFVVTPSQVAKAQI